MATFCLEAIRAKGLSQPAIPADAACTPNGNRAESGEGRLASSYAMRRRSQVETTFLSHGFSLEGFADTVLITGCFW